MALSPEFEPQYESEEITKLFKRKILKYIVGPRAPKYRDVIYFFLIPNNMLRTIPSVSGERHVVLVEVINDVGRDRLEELGNLFFADLTEPLDTPIGRRMKESIVSVWRYTDLLSQLQEMMQAFPELQRYTRYPASFSLSLNDI